MPAPSPYLTSAEAAAFCRLSYSHFKALQAKRRTPAKRLSRRVLYLPADLERWVDEITRRS